jgi:hypothetical protein
LSKKKDGRGWVILFPSFLYSGGELWGSGGEGSPVGKNKLFTPKAHETLES